MLFGSLANTHIAIETILEEFNDDQLSLMLDTERAFDDNTPNQPEANEATRREHEHETPTSLATLVDTKDKPKISAEQHLPTMSQPDIPSAQKEETMNQHNAEGILGILTED